MSDYNHYIYLSYGFAAIVLSWVAVASFRNYRQYRQRLMQLEGSGHKERKGKHHEA